MGILQAAYRTYENQAHRAGIAEEGKEPLTPISHAIQNAQVEIVIDADGNFKNAFSLDKGQMKTIIPVTIQSINRTSKSEPHPLCDQLQYLASFGGDKFSAYLKGLEEWAVSPYTHAKVQAVYSYVQKQTIVGDLVKTGIIPPDKAGNPDTAKCAKYLIRWRLENAPDGIKSACWEDTTLFSAFQEFYAQKCAQEERDICLITGQQDMVCSMHPKGVVASSFGAKLVSANDNAGFTYRGRFVQPEEAFNFGYEASQKAHHALRWIGANYGVILGGKTFLCWNPGGAELPTFSMLTPRAQDASVNPIGKRGDFQSYRKQLLQSLSGYREALTGLEDVVIACLDAATTGRLSVTYYNELKASDFLNRVQYWYESFCWDTRYDMRSPSLQRIVHCAFGSQQGNFIQADEKILKEYAQRMLSCVIDRQPLPTEIVRALVAKCANPMAYTPENREILLTTTCAALRKYYNDKHKREVWTVTLDENNKDRSYLYGRLLAIAEIVERSTYDRTETREPNAIRMQSVFIQRPEYAWNILHAKLTPYFEKHPPALRRYFRDRIAEVYELLPGKDDSSYGKRLSDEYLRGYYNQRTYMTTKKTATNEEGNNDESADE